MHKLLKLSLLPLAAVTTFIPTMASAQGLLGGLPLIRIGNGAPILGSTSSQIGIGILSNSSNGTPISVRLLGAEKLAGLSVLVPTASDKPLDLQLTSPIDGQLNSALLAK